MADILINRLRNLKKDIRFVLIGLGAMGKGLLYQSLVTPGIKCVALAEINIVGAIEFLRSLNIEYRTVQNLKELHETIQHGILAICEDGDILARCGSADILVESSSSISEAAKFSLRALQHQKHLVLMNAEIDLIFGPYLLEAAKKSGLVYTSCDGDQHSVIKRLADKIKLWGFDLVMAGNIKGFLDRYSDPAKIIPEADKRNLSYEMCAAMADGTKLNIEMAILSNALDLKTMKAGMNGPRAKHIHEVFSLFNFDKLWDGKPIADYVLGAEPDGGVFVIGHCNNPYQRNLLKYYKMGEGPFYLFYRPYHLCHVEAMECIANAYLDKVSLLKPDFGFTTNVFAYAKRDLKKGEKLDGLGSYTCYGLIDNYKDLDQDSGLPICISKDVTLKHDIKKDEKIFLADVQYDPERFDFDLYFKGVECSKRLRP